MEEEGQVSHNRQSCFSWISHERLLSSFSGFVGFKCTPVQSNIAGCSKNRATNHGLH